MNYLIRDDNDLDHGRSLFDKETADEFNSVVTAFINAKTMNPEDHLKPKFMVGDTPLYANDALKNYVDTQIQRTMNPPGNPTETDPSFSSERRSSPELVKLENEVIAVNESIANQAHIIWLAKVETLKLKAILKATIQSIETITKPKES